MDPSGQRGIPPQMQQIFIPIVSAGGRATLQPVMIPPGTVMAPGTAFAIPRTPLQTQSIAPVTIEPPPPPPRAPPVELYLCDSTKSASDLHSETSGEQKKEKASLAGLERSYQELNSRKVKDSLSSFLPDIPGEFDTVEPVPDAMLKGLIDRPPIGGKEFLPLSGQALLGFRLLPGVPLPEQYRLDPPSAAPKHHHRKRKHKHKTIDKSDDNRESSPLPAHSTKIPSDAYSFITAPASMLPSHPHHSQTVPKVITGGHMYQASSFATPVIAGAPQTLGGVDPSRITFFEKKRKKEKKKDRDKDKEKRKKEKKKKREKHHGQDPSLITHSHPVPPPLITHPPPPPFTQHQHPPT